MFEYFKTAIPFIITIIAFLWNRSSKLWKLYYFVETKCLEQICKNSIDRRQWSVIHKEITRQMTSEYFGTILRFEIEYLRYDFKKTIFEKLWISDSSANDKETIFYKEKEKYCKHILEISIGRKCTLFGIPLFIQALIWKLNRRTNPETGYTVIKNAKKS